MIWNQLSWFAVPALSLWILGVLLAQRKGSPAPAFLATLAGWLVLSVHRSSLAGPRQASHPHHG